MHSTTPEQFEKYLSAPEGTRLEFKAAKSSYKFEKLVNYCVALANERGGTMLLGVTDKRPREVVGTSAFPEPGETEASLHRALGHRIPIEEYHHDGKRVLIIHIPGRLPGTAWQIDGKYLKRAGDALVPMGAQELRTIFSETGPDFTAEIVPGAGFRDLQPEAVSEFRKRWQRKSGNTRLATMSSEQILHDCSLLDGAGINYAALILLGRPSAITPAISRRPKSSSGRNSGVRLPEPRSLCIQSFWDFREINQHEAPLDDQRGAGLTASARLCPPSPKRPPSPGAPSSPE